MNQVNSSFVVFYLYANNEGIQTTTSLIRELIPHGGHNSYNAAKIWIREQGNRNVDYIILEVLRTN